MRNFAKGESPLNNLGMFLKDIQRLTLEPQEERKKEQSRVRSPYLGRIEDKRSDHEARAAQREQMSRTPE